MIWCGGTFDLFHPGHLGFFRQVRKWGPVIAAVNRDEFAARYKRAPVMSQNERLEMVQACKYVDVAILNSHDERTGDAIDAWEKSLGDKLVTHIAHGDDWMGESLLKQLHIDQKWLDDRRIQMLYVPYTGGVSTTEVVNRVFRRYAA